MKRAASMPVASSGGSQGPTSKSFPLSEQQQAVVKWVKSGSGSAFVEALAGTGKTSTLIAASYTMRGSVAFAAFNKKIADEIKIKTAKNSNVRVATFHSFGFNAWKKAASDVQVDEFYKFKQMMAESNVPFNMQGAVGRLVSVAKQAVIGLLQDYDDMGWWRQMIEHHSILDKVEERYGYREEDTIQSLIEFSTSCLEWSREAGKTLVDFDDMIWLPLLEGVPVPVFDWLLTDEAQDTNAARRLLAERMVGKSSRSLWVGDKHQAVYGFTGADSDAVDRVVERFDCSLLPLTVTFRCSKAATRLAQTFVPQITAHESNNEGAVIKVSGNEFLYRYATDGYMPPMIDDGYSRDDADLEEVSVDADVFEGKLRPGDAILCRYNRPLVALAFQLIRKGIGCHVEGRDIGKSLVALANKWRVSNIRALTMRLEEYLERESRKLVDRKQGYQLEALNDKVETLFIIMEGCETVQQLKDKIGWMFKDMTGDGSNTITLSTVHKAKGREWDRVFILGWSKYMPSSMAKQDWEKQAERNIQYVAVTRTKGDLLLTGALD